MRCKKTPGQRRLIQTKSEARQVPVCVPDTTRLPCKSSVKESRPASFARFSATRTSSLSIATSASVGGRWLMDLAFDALSYLHPEPAISSTAASFRSAYHHSASWFASCWFRFPSATVSGRRFTHPSRQQSWQSGCTAPHLPASGHSSFSFYASLRHAVRGMPFQKEKLED